MKSWLTGASKEKKNWKIMTPGIWQKNLPMSLLPFCS
jgi:hypothetical protein